MVNVNQNAQSYQVVLTPNQSAPWAEVKMVCLLLAFFTAIIAGGWAFVGVWIILPFAGLELLLVSALMYQICKQGRLIQVVNLHADNIEVTTGYRKPEKQWTLTKSDTFLYCQSTKHPDDSPNVYLKNSDYCIQIGSFLNKNDTEQMLNSLESTGLVLVKEHWWER